MRAHRMWIGWVVAALLALPQAAHAKEVWDEPAFSVAPSKLMRAAKKVEVDGAHDVVILLEHGHYEFDAKGRRVFTFRRVFRVLTQEGVDGWSSISLMWSPWYQERPELRVRVVSPDGKAHELDEKTIDIAPAPTGSDHVYDNRRTLRAPFPAISVGAVVEERVVYRDTEPFFDEGNNYKFYFGTTVPIHRARLIIDAPKSRKLKISKHLLPKVKRKTTRRGKIVRTTFAARDLPPDDTSEGYLPADVHPYAHVAFSTGRSWSRVAKAYHAIVEAQIAANDVADLAAKLPRTGDKASRVAAALALVNDNVRYTGIELGMNSIVPWSPAETWKRKFGDCKDKATLLVALLRHIDIEAHVALLNAGYGYDSDPAMPGLGVFNHAIVVVPGKAAIWIDPTNEYARAGELPVTDQGRWALIASPKTKKVVRTPIAASTDNQMIERREIQLAEQGESRVVETTTMRGAFERRYRVDYRADDPKKTRESLTKYVENEYLAKELVSYTHSDAEDLSTPFELRIEAAGSSRAFTSGDVASVYMFPSDLLSEVYSELRNTAKDAKRRKHDFYMPAFVREFRYVIEPPPGFELRDLPDAETIAVGPMRVTTTFRKAKNKSVEASLRLDTVQHRFTPDEVDAVRAAAKDLGDRPGIQIVFDQVGMRHLNAGDIPEALREFRRLVKLHPKEALHRSQLALALLEAGLAKQARAAAQRAVKLEPKSAEARNTYAWVLQHDDAGRRFGPGWRRAEVIRQYLAGIKLDPKWSDLHANLAIVYEYDAKGRRYRGELDKSIAAYQRLRKDVDDKSYDLNLLVTMLHAGKYEQARKLAKSIGDARSVQRLAAAAAKGGAKGLDREIRAMGLSGATLSDQLRQAGFLLMTIREYKSAAAAWRKSAGAASNAAEIRSYADLIGKVQRHEDGPIPRTDPRYVFVQLMANAFESEYVDEQAILRLMAKRARAGGTGGGMAGAGIKRLSQQMAELGISNRTVVDITASLMKLTVESAKPWGWKVELRGTATMPVAAQTMFLIRENNKYRIIGFSTTPQTLAAHALDLANRNKLDGAAQWLDWAREHAPPEIKGSPLHKSAFKVLWPEVGKRTRQRARLAAAALMARSPDYATEAIAVLRKCDRKHQIVAAACDIALFRAYRSARQYDKALAQLERLEKAHPSAKKTVWDDERLQLYELLGKLDKVEASAKVRIAKDLEDRGARRALARVAIRRNELSKALEIYEGLIAEDNAFVGDYNQFAWISLFFDGDYDKALDAAQRAVAIGKREGSPSLNTLAAVHAARGEYRTAYQVMIESMGVADATALRSQDWLVFGRIHAGLGYRKDAAAAYARVKSDLDIVQANISSHALAKRWKRGLRKSK